MPLSVRQPRIHLLFSFAISLTSHFVLAQGTTNPIPSAVPTSSIQLRLEDVIRIPNARLELLTQAGDGSGFLYVADQFGAIYSFHPNDPDPSSTLDGVLRLAGHAPGFRREGGQRGLRSFAFHPDHLTEGTPGFRKLYTAHSVTNSGAPNHDSVVAEWTLQADGNVDTSIPPREILRQEQPRGDHNIGRIGFDPNATLGDPDYANLYIALGDGGNYRTPGDSTLNPNGQDTTNWLGSILRVDPATPDESAGTAYTVPADNPFVGDDAFLPEIWAYGLRNPHTFSWDIGGSGNMYIGDIGQSGIEEVNLGQAGANYGWSAREGTFSVEGKLPDASNPIAIDALPADHATDDYTYPVAQYDHSLGSEGNQIGNSAIVGGFVYRGNQVSELSGKYLFGDFANNHGPIYLVDETELDQEEDFINLAGQDGGYLAPFKELVLLDDSNQPTTLLDIIREAGGNSSLGRTDLRFGQGADGEIYVLNKQDGWIRRFVGTPVPEPTSAVLLLLGGIWFANATRKKYIN